MRTAAGPYLHVVAAVLLVGCVHNVLAACTLQHISSPSIADLNMNQKLQTPFIVKGMVSTKERAAVLDAIQAQNLRVTALASPTAKFGVTEDGSLWPASDRAGGSQEAVVFVAGAWVNSTMKEVWQHGRRGVSPGLPSHVYLNMYGVEAQAPELSSALPPVPHWASRLIRERKFRGGNLWMGGNTTSSAHFDGYDNILMVMAGRKRLVLFHPLHEDLTQHQRTLDVGEMRWSPYQGFKRLPLAQNSSQTACRLPFNLTAVQAYGDGMRDRGSNRGSHMQPRRCGLEAGDAIYLPALWWHQVESEATMQSPCVAINHWFQPKYVRKADASGALRWAPMTRNPVYDELEQ